MNYIISMIIRIGAILFMMIVLNIIAILVHKTITPTEGIVTVAAVIYLVTKKELFGDN